MRAKRMAAAMVQAMPRAGSSLASRAMCCTSLALRVRHRAACGAAIWISLLLEHGKRARGGQRNEDVLEASSSLTFTGHVRHECGLDSLVMQILERHMTSPLLCLRWSYDECCSRCLYHVRGSHRACWLLWFPCLAQDGVVGATHDAYRG
jgi:hypothetical protein